MVTPQSPTGTIYNSSPRRPSPGEVVQIPDAVRARCMRGAHAVRILPLRGSLKRSATIWASGRTRDPYFEILGAPRGIMVTPSGGFEF